MDLTASPEKLPYPITIARGSAWQLPQLLAERPFARLVVVSDREVAVIYQDQLTACFVQAGVNAQIIAIECNEAGKTLDSVRTLYDQLLDMDMSVNDLLVAFGGGSLIDVVTFVGATFLGGLEYVLVPTTLLAMADSSSCLHSRLNFRTSKNLLGVACQPLGVYIDVDLLQTLPAKHLANGFAQVIQYGYVQDPHIINLLEEGCQDMEELIRAAIRAKQNLLAANPDCLDFGQPVCNAIEGHFRFLKYPHGEALALGMLAACPDERLHNLLLRYHLPTHLEGVGADSLVRRMQRLDLQQGALVRLIRVSEPGQPYVQILQLNETEAVYQSMLAVLMAP